jgi:hypothetical protein
MKHAEMAAHSSGRSGGDRRVLHIPVIGVLQTIGTATDRIVASLYKTQTIHATVGLRDPGVTAAHSSGH